jgi:SAM-dependent methyltransferase
VGKLSRADYGFDTPVVPVGLAVAAVVLVGLTVVVAVSTAGWWWLMPLAYGLFFGLSCACYVYTTRRGKFVVWAGLLAELQLTGRERVVDLGCGRGAVLIMLARLVPRGRAVGVDLWRSVDQSGNDPASTLTN